MKAALSSGSCHQLPRLLLPLLLLLLLLLSAPRPLHGEAAVAANLGEFARTCAKSDNLAINRVCSGVPNETLRLFGEDFGVHYVRSNVKSRVFVGLILSKCKPGDYCVHLSQAEPTELEDRLLISWKDERVRRNLCSLRPCLSRLPDCGGNQERQLTFNAVGLLCGITELQDGVGGGIGFGSGTPYCLEGALDLLQYAYADIDRSSAARRKATAAAAAMAAAESVQSVCDCVGRTIPCLDRCRLFIYKLNCLYSQCLPHERRQITSFPAWRWYFANSTSLKAKYNVTFCERPIETAAAAAGNRGPVILAFFPNMANVVMAVVMVVVISALLMVAITCVCWQRIFLNKYSRDRVQYTEVKGTL